MKAVAQTRWRRDGPTVRATPRKRDTGLKPFSG